MTHVRTAIREAFAGLLTGLPSSGSRVHISRAHALDRRALPAIVVRTGNEVIERMVIHAQPPLLRRVFVAVDCFVDTSTPAEDALDQMTLEVEEALQTSTTRSTLDGLLVEPMQLERIEVQLDDGSGSQIGRLSLIYAVTYRTREGAPDSNI